MELKDLNQYKDLPAKEFDALLGKMLKEQADKRRAEMPKRAPKGEVRPVVEKKK